MQYAIVQIGTAMLSDGFYATRIDALDNAREYFPDTTSGEIVEYIDAASHHDGDIVYMSDDDWALANTAATVEKAVN